MSNFLPWHVSGSYFEVCNCEAICPCRRQGDRPGGRSTYDVCDFALSWQIKEGYAGAIGLSNLAVVMAGRWYNDIEGPPWRVILYVDEHGDLQQREALADIFLGRAGGTTLRNFARAIGEVYAVRVARIELDHTPNQERLQAGEFVSANTARPVITDKVVSCGIPGHDHPGQEIIAENFQVNDSRLYWEVSGRCGFASDFVYSSEA